MSDQHSGVEDEVKRALRLGLATASQTADRYVRTRQDLARQAQHRSEQEARQLEVRIRAEGASAAARLALMDRAEWWDRATPADITSMWQLAAQWQDEHPRAAIAADTIVRQVRDRYGLEVAALGVDAGVVRAAEVRMDQEQRDPVGRPQGDDTASALAAVLRAGQRDAALAGPSEWDQQVVSRGEASEFDRSSPLGSAADHGDRQPAQGGSASRTARELQMPAADARAQAVLHRSEVAAPLTQAIPDSSLSYDSAERRELTATRLKETGLSPEVVAVAMRADVAHAQSANEALTAEPTIVRSGAIRATTRRAHEPDRNR